MIKKLFNIFSGKKKPSGITIVSGLPRSGTSMMMNMLEVGGIPPLTDHKRPADDDNPGGYYEYERVKKLPKGDSEWLKNAEGKALKVISALLNYLPSQYQYQILFMERTPEEVAASQKKMLIRRGEDPDKISDEELTLMFSKHLRHTEDWLKMHQHHLSYLKVSYNDTLKDPESISKQVNSYLGNTLDTTAMAAVVEPTLYRNKGDNIEKQ